MSMGINFHLDNEKELDMSHCDKTSNGTHYFEIQQGLNNVTFFGSLEQLKQIADAINNYVERW